jgi:hypothetical protein
MTDFDRSRIMHGHGLADTVDTLLQKLTFIIIGHMHKT